MFIVVEGHSRHTHKTLVDRMFRLREEVFYRQLGWSVDVGPRGEIDVYDDANPAYLMWCDDSGKTLYGCLRLLPTTGPTLLYSVFRKTFPDAVCLSAPGIWEGTRLCIDEAAIARDMPHIDARRAFCLMLLALCETALAHGIHTLISNYEPPTRRLYKMAGAEFEELGRCSEFGKRPVCSGRFEVSDEVLKRMRSRLGIREPLLTRETARSRGGLFEMGVDAKAA